MIIQLEIEQMIKELSNHDSDKARAYINVLNRTLLEMKEQHEALRQSMLLTSSAQLDSMRLIQENRRLMEENRKLSLTLENTTD